MKKTVIALTCTLISWPAFCAPMTKPEPSPTATWIAFLPVIFFTIVLLWSLFSLKNNNVPLKGLLAEKDLTTQNSNNITAPASVSRFIVLLSGLTAVMVSTCLTTFYIYQYFINPATPPGLSHLSNVLWGFGVGVIPYSLNKVTSNLKNEPAK